jgi:hypothetical protein
VTKHRQRNAHFRDGFKNEQAKPVKADYPAAVAFALSLPTKQIHLCAIHPTKTLIGKDGREHTVIHGRSFDRSDAAGILDWISTAQDHRRFNLYYNGNDMSCSLGKFKWKVKASEADMSVLHFLHCDSEVDKALRGMAFDTARAELLARIQTDDKPPSIIIDSGNGYQLFWQVDPVIITDENREDIKARNIALRDKFNGDNCQDLCHVMRLPFTLNYPNAAKLARGRKVVASGIVSDDRALYRYSMKEFPAAKIEQSSSQKHTTSAHASTSKHAASAHADLGSPWPSMNVSLVKLDSDLVRLIEHGPKEGARQIGDGSRSAWLYYVVSELRRLNWALEDVLGILLNPDYAINAHIADQKQRTQIEQASRVLRDVWEREQPMPHVTDQFEVEKLLLIDKENRKRT